MEIGTPAGQPPSISARPKAGNGDGGREDERRRETLDRCFHPEASLAGGRRVSVARYLIVIYRTGTGYSAHVPDVLGCIAAGSSVEKTRRMLAEALEMHFEAMRE